ncbi:MAG: peptidyl-prolyl cis-trans isomerase [Terriglobales bacterium]
MIALCTAPAQVASHAPTAITVVPSGKPLPASSAPKLLEKPVARVNGVVLTEQDLLREIAILFPYVQQHNAGIPKSMEPEIRRGALEMIIFEELLYQEAKRRRLTIPAQRLARAEAQFRKRFPTQAEYQQYLQVEANGSPKVMRNKIHRSLLIEKMLESDVRAKAKVTLAEARAYYQKNTKQFEHGESFRIQSISILPPDNSPAVLKEAQQRAEEAAKAAKGAKDYREFGLLAERLSDDDFRVKMGDHKQVDAGKLPPEIIKAARAMKPGQVSDLIRLGNAYTIFRLVKHTPAGRTPFAEVKDKLMADLHKEKTEKVRAALGQKLRQNAQIERL